jgi:hypothetical protein
MVFKTVFVVAKSIPTPGIALATLTLVVIGTDRIGSC